MSINETAAKNDIIFHFTGKGLKLNNNKNCKTIQAVLNENMC